MPDPQQQQTDPVLAALEATDRDFRTVPFLALGGSGVNCYNVPAEKLPHLVRAFAVLFGVAPTIRVRGRAHASSLQEDAWFPMPTTVSLPDRPVDDPLREGWVQVHLEGQASPTLYYPHDGLWPHVELETPPRA